MRKDWDYVSMEDYVSDTKELSERAGTCIAELKRRAEHAEALLWLAVKAAGGKIEIQDSDLVRLRNGQLDGFICECFINAADRTRIYKVRRADVSPE